MRRPAAVSNKGEGESMAFMFATFSQTDRYDIEFSQSEAILPFQYYGDRRGAAAAEPLKRLLVAMLVDGVRCFQTRSGARRPAQRRDFEEAQSWIFSDVDDGPFSFRAVSEALEIDPQGLRRGLLRWEEQRRSGEKPRIVRRSSFAAAKRMAPIRSESGRRT
jgi:hypothetical protein